MLKFSALAREAAKREQTEFLNQRSFVPGEVLDKLSRLAALMMKTTTQRAHYQYMVHY